MDSTPDTFENPDHSREKITVDLVEQRTITHAEIMDLAGNKIRGKILDILKQDDASPTILAQYSLLAAVIQHTANHALTFMDIAVGSGTVNKIAEAIALELGIPYGTSASDNNLLTNGSMPYRSPASLSSISSTSAHAYSPSKLNQNQGLPHDEDTSSGLNLKPIDV